MSTPDVDQITEELKKANSRTLDPVAVYSQMGLMTAISLATILAFAVLRPRNKIIYEPKVKYHIGNKPPPRISNGLFGWLPPVLHTKEPELIEKVGLDAVAFLRFLRMMRWIFTAIAAVCGCVLVPINVIYNIKNSTDHSVLTMLTIRDVQGNALFAHVGATYVITIIICAFVYIHWKAMARLRNNWFRSPEFIESFYSRTLTVRNIPRKYQSDAGVKAIFDGVKVPYPTTSVHIGRRVGKLPELIEYHNTTVRQLEQVLVKYLKNGRIGKTRPKIRIGGFLGMGGTQFDGIDYYTAKLKRTEAAIEDYRSQIDSRKAEPYGFASMAAVPYAHIVAKILANKNPHGTDIALAPNPKDIIWANMDMTDAARVRKRLWGMFWLVVVCFLNTFPLILISFLANLNALTKWVDILQKWKDASKTSFDVVSGVLPPAVSAIFGFFLPIIIRRLSQYMGDLTQSKLDRSVISHYFSFLIVSQLIIFTLIGVFLSLISIVIGGIGKQSFKDVIKALNLKELPSHINQTYIDQSSYWLTFFPLRGFLVLFDLAQIVNLLWLSFKTRVFGRTPRDIREWTQPPEFQYAVYYSNTLFMGTVGLVFAPLAPAVVVAGTIVMWISSWVYKYQLMFVFVSRVETGGRLWNMVVNRLLFSVVLMQLIMVLTIGISKGFRSFIWVSALPPIVIVAVFKMYINRAFLPTFMYYIPTQQELQAAKVHSERSDSSRNRLEKRFGHSALHTELFTPMLHAKMMPLLSQVYNGKVGTAKTKLDEYNGQNMNAHIVDGGVKIAAIDQNDLERPDLYGRDRGELDWDTRSIASTTVFGDSDMGHSSGKGAMDYDKYLAQGPGHMASAAQSDIELSRMDSMNEPLLSPRNQMYHQQQSSQLSMAPSYQAPSHSGMMSSAPLHRQGTSDSSYTSPPPQQQQFYPPRTNQPYNAPPPQNQSPYNSSQHHPGRFQSPQQAPRGGYGGNMAGRGAHRS